MSRKVEGKLLNLTVTKDGGDWFVSITTRVTWKVEPPTGPPIAFDLGIAKSLAFSDRTEVHLPVATPKELRQKGRLQRAIARKQKGSKRRKKAVARLGNHERHICQRVNDSRHKITSSRANNHSLVIGEALRTCNMTRSAKGTLDEPGTNVRQKAGLNRGILAQGWGITRRQFAYKCRWRGGHYIEVDPRGTSQRCNECDHEEPRQPPDASPVFMRRVRVHGKCRLSILRQFVGGWAGEGNGTGFNRWGNPSSDGWTGRRCSSRTVRGDGVR